MGIIINTGVDGKARIVLRKVRRQPPYLDIHPSSLFFVFLRFRFD